MASRPVAAASPVLGVSSPIVTVAGSATGGGPDELPDVQAPIDGSITTDTSAPMITDGRWFGRRTVGRSSVTGLVTGRPYPSVQTGPFQARRQTGRVIDVHSVDAGGARAGLIRGPRRVEGRRDGREIDRCERCEGCRPSPRSLRRR